MRRLVLGVAAAALAGCGGADRPPAPKPHPLPVLRRGDWPGAGLDLGVPFEIETVEDQAAYDRNRAEVPALRRDGWAGARTVSFGVGTSGGASTATRFRDAAAARHQLRLLVAPRNRRGVRYLRGGAVARLPSGRYEDYAVGRSTCRYVYAVVDEVVFAIGYCADSSRGAKRGPLIAAMRGIVARAG